MPRFLHKQTNLIEYLIYPQKAFAETIKRIWINDCTDPNQKFSSQTLP